MDKYLKSLPVILLIVIAIVTLVPFIFTGFSNADDMSYYIATKTGQFWRNAAVYAREQGRFYFIFTIPLVHTCYLFDNFLISKSINVFLVLINFMTMGFIAKELFGNKWEGILCFILLVIFVSIKGIYNPIVSYPLYFTGSFLFILLSVYYAIRYANTGLNKYRSISAVLFALGLLFYETYLMYLPLILLIAFTGKSANKACFFAKFKKTIPYLIVGATYCIIYFSYRLVYPSQYAGATISGDFSFNRFYNSVLNFTSGSYPLSLTFGGGGATYGGVDYFLSNRVGNIIYFILSDHIEWILKSVIVLLLFYFVLNKIVLNKPKKIAYIFFISLIFIFLPQVPLSLTEKYLDTGGIPNYITTYFSYFTSIFCLAIIIHFVVILIRNFKYRKIVYLVISIFMGLTSVLNDYANYHATQSLRVPLNVYNFVDEFLKTGEYNSIPENTFIYAPDLYDTREDIVHFTMLYDWSIYFSMRNKKAVKVSGSKNELIHAMHDGTRGIYYINYGRNQYDMDQFIAFSAISNQSEIDSVKENIVSDSAVVFYYTNNKTFSVLFNRFPESPYEPVIINNDTLVVNQGRIELDVINKNYVKNFVKINIKSRNIDVKSIFLSNIAEDKGITVFLE